MKTEVVIEQTAGVLPGLIAEAGQGAARRLIEFFTVNIRNRNTRAAYARAAAVFLRWCEGQGITRHGAPPRFGRRHRNRDRLSHLPRDRNYGLLDERRAHRGRAKDGRTFERENNRPLRPAQR